MTPTAMTPAPNRLKISPATLSHFITCPPSTYRVGASGLPSLVCGSPRHRRLALTLDTPRGDTALAFMDSPRFVVAHAGGDRGHHDGAPPGLALVLASAPARFQ